jgi:3-oxoadipate enol-lactonase
LVLVPGLAGGIRLLGPLAKLLAQDFRVIAYQLRGEDNCFAMRRQFGMDDLVSDLSEFLDHLCLETPAILGVSFGGIIALDFAARYPRRLSSLAVQGVGSRFQGGLIERVASTVLSRFPLPTDSPFVNQFFNLLFGCAQKKDALFDFVIRHSWQTDQSVMAHRFRLVEAYNLDARLHRIRVSTLVLNGQRDVLVSQRTLQDLCNGIEHAKLIRMPAGGHLAFVTHPQLVAENVKRFLTSLQPA